MIINSLRLENIISFFGISDLRFETSRESNISVIFARNNSGKTSIIRALRFLLYGDTHANLCNLVNFEARKRARKGDVILMSVQVKFESQGVKTTICREFTAMKQADEGLDITPLDSVLKRVWHSSDGDIVSTEAAAVQGHINGIIPKELFDFYFFKGEELSGKLSEKDRNIVQGIENVLHERSWQEAKSSLLQVQAQLTRDLNRLNKDDQKRSKLEEEIALLTKSLSEVSDDIGKKQNEYDSCKQIEKDIDRAKTELAARNNPQIKELVKKLESSIAAARRNQAECRIRKKSEIGRYLPVMFSEKLLQEAEGILKKRNTEFGLPANISEEFISRILKSKMCICGRSFETGSDAEKSIIEYGKQALSKQLSTTLCSLFSAVDPAADSYLLRFNSAIIDRIRDYSEKIDSYESSISRDEAQKADLQSQYDENAQSEFENLQVQHEEIKDLVLRTYRALNDAILKRNRYEESLAQKNKERKNLANSEETKKLVRALDVTAELIEDIERCRLNFRRSYHNFLQEKTATVYNEIVTDGSESVVDKRTFLPSIYRSGVRILNNGGGQEQTLVLAYISALSELRRQVNSDLRKLFHVKNLDEQCFFMDSVFANMDDTYRIRAAKALAGSMKQLVLLLSPQQWAGPIAEGLKDSVTQAFFMTLHTPKNESDDLSMDYYGKQLNLLQPIANPVGEQEAYTSLSTIDAKGSKILLTQVPFVRNKENIDKVIDFIKSIENWPAPARGRWGMYSDRNTAFSIINQRNNGDILSDKQVDTLVRIAQKYGMESEAL